MKTYPQLSLTLHQTGEAIEHDCELNLLFKRKWNDIELSGRQQLTIKEREKKL
jgi:hypothetical protein